MAQLSSRHASVVPRLHDDVATSTPLCANTCYSVTEVPHLHYDITTESSPWQLSKLFWWRRWNKYVKTHAFFLDEISHCDVLNVVVLEGGLVGSSVWSQASRVWRESWLYRRPSLSCLFFLPNLWRIWMWPRGAGEWGKSTCAGATEGVCVSLSLHFLVHVYRR